MSVTLPIVVSQPAVRSVTSVAAAAALSHMAGSQLHADAAEQHLKSPLICLSQVRAVQGQHVARQAQQSHERAVLAAPGRRSYCGR